MSTVREIAERLLDGIVLLGLYYDTQMAEDVKALAGHVLASTEPLGDEGLQDLISSECTTCGEKALIAEIRRLQVELKDFGRQRSELLQGWHNTEADLRAQLYRANLDYFEEAKDNKDLRAQLQAAQQEREELRELACQDADIAGYYGDDPESANQCFVQKIRELLDAQWKLLRTLNCGSLDAIQSATETLRQLADERGREVERLGPDGHVNEEWRKRAEEIKAQGHTDIVGKKLVIVMNHGPKMTRGKFAAQAVHAALVALGAHPGTPVIVISGSASTIESMPIKIRDAGRTELEPGTLTAGAAWIAEDEKFASGPQQ